MAEFIGARISLVSRSDIRYVGTLHEINSETSTVALENVSSFGTEGRKTNAEEEIPPSDSVYEYIVFRGSDVKDLRIEEVATPKENKPPQVPNDPAILGSGTRPVAQSQPQRTQLPSQQGGPPQGPQGLQQQHQQHGPSPGVPPYGQHPGQQQYPPPFYPPPLGGWGRGGPQGPNQHGFPPMPYGGPPGWYPGPGGQGFPPPFPPYGYPQGPHPQGPQFQQPPQGPAAKPSPIGAGVNKQPTPPVIQQAEKEAEPKSLAKPAEMPAAAVTKMPSSQGPAKPSPKEEKVPVAQLTTAQIAANAAATKPTSIVHKAPGRVQPALPLQTPTTSKAPLQSASANIPPAAKGPDASSSLRDATQAATAAVAAAMAKLPPVGQANGSAVDNLQRKVNEMKINDPVRAPRHPGGTNFGTGRGARGGRSGPRGGSAGQKIDVPKTDFDFESANAKFNKQDLVKETIAGSPLGENPPAASPEVPEVPVSVYNKATSFFDNISSESKDRAEAGNSRPGGREWRGEEQKKNVETFGQGSVDNGYRGGYRGRGRGRGGYRGRGYSGNGQPTRGRGGYRGRGDAQALVQ